MGRCWRRPSFMLRFVGLLLLIVFILSIVRTIASVVKASLRELTSGSRPRANGESSGPKVIGELKKDPVCGTYISTQTEFRKIVHGETVYFCSASCRDKYK
jgi:YHS domain-containing protein